jgi:DNA-binding transcriptional MerR regulator
MPYKEKEIEKLYYPIGEVAEMLNVTTSLLRFWEKEFDILKPKKNKKGDRFFTKKDLENLKIIYNLVKEQGYTLNGARKKLEHGKGELENKVQIVASLNRVKIFLNELKNGL